MENQRTQMPIGSVTVPASRPAVLNSTVDALADSIKQVGLLNPLTVDRHGTLISGAHRLEACKRLGWTAVGVNMVSLEGLRAELAEIDENLIRNHDIHYLQMGDRLARRKEIYEALHPKTRNGMRNGQTSKNEIISFLETPAFTEDIANKMGVTRRTIEQSVQMAENLTPEAKEAIVKHDVPKSEAIAIAREEPDAQVPRVLSFAAERAKQEKAKLERDLAQIDYDYANIRKFRNALMDHDIYEILDHADIWLPSVAAADENFQDTIGDIDRVMHVLAIIKNKLILLKGGHTSESKQAPGS